MVELFACPALVAVAAAVGPSGVSSASTEAAIEATDFPSFDSSAAACWDSFDSLAAGAFQFAGAAVGDVVAVVAGEGSFDLKLGDFVSFC